MKIFITIVSVCMIILSIFQAIMFLRTKNFIFMNVIAFFCVAYGAIGFFGMSMYSSKGITFLDKYEWPVGNAENVLEIDESYVVPLPNVSRIQIYDKNLNYIRGWRIDSFGCDFRLFKSNDNIRVITSKKSLTLLYDIEGKLLFSKKNKMTLNKYEKLPKEGIPLTISNNFLLKIFEHLLYSWGLMFLGIIIGAVSHLLSKKKCETISKVP